jgi:hypothetical protein
MRLNKNISFLVAMIFSGAVLTLALLVNLFG